MASVAERPELTTNEAETDASRGVKRYQLVLPAALYAKVQEAAEERDTTVVQLLRTFIRLGLMTLEAEKHPGGELILRVDGAEKQLVIV